MALDFEQARSNMVQHQVRPWEVLDEAVLGALSNIPREEFVQPEHRRLAYADLMLPIGEGQIMMKPVVEGRLLQALELNEDDEVLEIGTGSGFLTCCLANLAGHVTTIEYHKSLCEQARVRLERLCKRAIDIRCGDVFDDFKPPTQPDALVVTGALSSIPALFKDWVAPGGRMFVIIGNSPVLEAWLLHRVETDQWRRESLFDTDLPYLIGAEPTEEFRL